MRALVVIALAGASLGCSVLGTGPTPPDGLPHGGTGPFRDLREGEAGALANGSPIAEPERVIENAMVIDDRIFYGAAELMGGPTDVQLPDAGVRLMSPDWRMVGPRRIHRGARVDPDQVPFAPRDVVLEASAGWEGGYVHDPWVVHREDGAILYYAGAGGIGIARAADLDATFTRVGTEPVIALEGARRPSVIDASALPVAETDGGTVGGSGYLMYFEHEGAIQLARSEDGLAWETIGQLEVPEMAARDDRDGEEIAVGAPAAIVASTPAGRSTVRIYYESRRSNGRVLAGMAGTFDGVTDVAILPVPVTAARDDRFPMVTPVDERTSLIYYVSFPMGVRTGRLTVGIAPGGLRLGCLITDRDAGCANR